MPALLPWKLLVVVSTEQPRGCLESLVLGELLRGEEGRELPVEVLERILDLLFVGAQGEQVLADGAGIRARRVQVGPESLAEGLLGLAQGLHDGLEVGLELLGGRDLIRGQLEITGESPGVVQELARIAPRP